MYIFPDTLTGILVHVFQISVALIAPIFLDHPNKDLYVTSRGIISLKVFDFFNPVNVIVSTGFGLYWWARRPLRDLSPLSGSFQEWKSCFPGIILVLLNYSFHGHFFMGVLWVFLLGFLGGIALNVQGYYHLRH